MYPALAATLAALTATGVGDVPGGWAPVDSDGVHRHAALGLFDLQALKPAQAQATKSSRNPLFGQDKAWETRIDNGCEAAPAPACTSTIPSRYPKVSPGSFGEQSTKLKCTAGTRVLRTSALETAGELAQSTPPVVVHGAGAGDCI